MRTTTIRTKKAIMENTGDLLSLLSEKIVGQTPALEAIVPYVQMYQAGLAPEGRPVGVFLLLGTVGFKPLGLMPTEPLLVR